MTYIVRSDPKTLSVADDNSNYMAELRELLFPIRIASVSENYIKLYQIVQKQKYRKIKKKCATYRKKKKFKKVEKITGNYA